MSEEFLEIKDDLQHSIEIGQTAKLTWQIKSIKVYLSLDDWESAVEKLFLIRDEVIRRINNG